MYKKPSLATALIVVTSTYTTSALAQTTQPAAAETDDQEPTLNELTAAEKAAGWQSLFDGESLIHWRGYNREHFPEKGWTIEDDAIKVIQGGGGGDIITTEMYDNFEFIVEFRVAEKANSGIMYRVREDENTSWKTGPEFQVLDDAGSGLAPDHVHTTGSVYDLYAAPADKPLKPVGEYNEARIIIDNGQLQHWLNGEKVVQVDLNGEEWKAKVAASKFKSYEGFGINERGHICLQDHGNDVWYRNIRIRNLDEPMPDAERLFDDMDGDNVTTFFAGGNTSDDTFTVDDDGILHCTGKPAGYIRTTKDYTNFVLKLQWRFDAEKGAGNSGVLLRMVGDDKVWPKSVEAQLHSGNAGDFWNIDKFEMSTDAERTNGRNTKKTHTAEKPVGEWNDYEIIVDRGNITLIVNGEQVNEAWDVEEVAGKICLQSEGAPIQFRNIQVAEIQ